MHDLLMPRAAHELSRVGLFGALPGERLAKLGDRMRREQIAPGNTVVREGDEDDRFYVVLDGVLAVSNEARGPRRVLRTGDYFGEVAPMLDVPRTATVHALTPTTVVSCDRATFDEFIRPLFADD
jgi:CRP-like cAMP-binding protein